MDNNTTHRAKEDAQTAKDDQTKIAELCIINKELPNTEGKISIPQNKNLSSMIRIQAKPVQDRGIKGVRERKVLQ